MSETVLVPGARDVRATLDEPADVDGDGGPAHGCVVACPPHPQLGGSRSDGRLRAVADALAERGVATLRFDYGPWDEGAEECRDARNAVEWASDRYDAVGLFGYSFGGSVALLTAADLGESAESGGAAGGGGADDPTAAPDAAGTDSPTLAAVSALAPAARIGADLDAAAALSRIACPGQVIYGERDDTADWKPVVERARELDLSVVPVAGDHHFVGQRERVAEHVATFLADALGASE